MADTTEAAKDTPAAEWHNVSPAHIQEAKGTVGPRSSRVDDVVAAIQAGVMEGAIAVGSWLRQDAIAHQFGISRTPVREALQKLEANGIVELVPHRGAIVRGPTPRGIREAYRVRAELEGLAAELAAERIQPDELERLRCAAVLFTSAVQPVEQGERARDDESSRDETWRRANTLFHEIVQEAAGNERLCLVIGDLHGTFPRNLTWAALRENRRLLLENAAEHQVVFRAIAKGDGAAARAAMANHVRRSGELIADWFERHPSGAEGR